MRADETSEMKIESPAGLQATWLSIALGVSLGCFFLSVSLIPSESWSTFFMHPLQSPEGNPPPQLRMGILFLRVLLPICGFCWFGVAWLIYTKIKPASSPAEPASRSTARSSVMVICLAVIGALLLRLPLMNDSLWYDEIAAFWYYGQFGPGPILGNMFTPANHIAQSLATWSLATINRGDLDPITLRLPALVVGLACLWPMWILGRESLGERWSLVSILLLAASPIAVLESTEARGYAFMLFFSASACALMTLYLRHKRYELLPWYAICCSLGIWSHLVTVVVPIGHACLLVWLVCLNQPMNRRALWGLASITLAAVTTCTLLAPILPQLWEGSAEYQAVQADQPTLFGREGRWLLLGLGGSWAYLGGAAGLLLVVFGIVSGRHNPAFIRGVLVCGLPIVVALSLILLIGTWIYARFLVLGLPFTILAITAGVASLNRRTRLVGVILLVLMLVGWAADLRDRYETPRQPVREIVQSIPNNGSRIGVIGVVDFPIVVGWYVSDPERIIDCGNSLKDSTARLKRNGVEWLVIGYPQQTIPDLSASTPIEPGNSTLVDGFTVVEFKRGWIDEDGSMILLKREST